MKNVWMGNYQLFINVARFSTEKEWTKDSRSNDNVRGKEKMKTQEHKDQKVIDDRRFSTYMSNIRSLRWNSGWNPAKGSLTERSHSFGIC
ncbi:hypothetical protein Hanom_Chr07g00594941 [Helianthus anomalus]